MSDTLSPCPFCGETDDIEFTEDNRARYIRCLICLMRGPMRYDGDSAIKAWERRTPSPWIDFRERRPEDGQHILVWWRHEEPEFENDIHWHAMTARRLPSEPKIYFWRPLPDPPSPEQIARAKEKHEQSA